MRNTRFETYFAPRLPRDIQLKRLHAVIREELTENQREVLTQYYFEERSMTEIARERGVNISTVSRTIRRAEERLRKFLKY